MSVLNLGAAVRIKEEIGIVMGFFISQVDNKIKPQYIVVPFPEGYKNARSLKIIDFDAVEPISAGFSCEYSDNVVRGVEGIYAAGEHVSYEEFTKYVNEYVKKREEE